MQLFATCGLGFIDSDGGSRNSKSETHRLFGVIRVTFLGTRCSSRVTWTPGRHAKKAQVIQAVGDVPDLDISLVIMVIIAFLIAIYKWLIINQLYQFGHHGHHFGPEILYTSRGNSPVGQYNLYSIVFILAYRCTAQCPSP